MFRGEDSCGRTGLHCWLLWGCMSHACALVVASVLHLKPASGVATAWTASHWLCTEVHHLHFPFEHGVSVHSSRYTHNSRGPGDLQASLQRVARRRECSTLRSQLQEQTLEVCHLQQKVADLSSSSSARLQEGAQQQRPLSAPQPVAGPAGGPLHDCELLPYSHGAGTASKQSASGWPYTWLQVCQTP